MLLAYGYAPAHPCRAPSGIWPFINPGFPLVTFHTPPMAHLTSLVRLIYSWYSRAFWDEPNKAPKIRFAINCYIFVALVFYICLFVAHPAPSQVWPREDFSPGPGLARWRLGRAAGLGSLTVSSARCNFFATLLQKIEAWCLCIWSTGVTKSHLRQRIWKLIGEISFLLCSSLTLTLTSVWFHPIT